MAMQGKKEIERVRRNESTGRGWQTQRGDVIIGNNKKQP
jgi:hypothetical protein